MNLFLIETGDTVAPVTPEESAAYQRIGDELQADAIALLATVRNKLSGYEIAVCESAADIENSDGVDVGCLMRMQITFSREIANHKDRKGVLA